jgi:hypothetical protein
VEELVSHHEDLVGPDVVVAVQKSNGRPREPDFFFRLDQTLPASSDHLIRISFIPGKQSTLLFREQTRFVSLFAHFDRKNAQNLKKTFKNCRIFELF